MNLNTPRIIECSRCGCEWNVSCLAHIPASGYVCPHCTSREREDGPIWDGGYKANKAQLSKVEDFKNWLCGDGWRIEQTKGIYEVVRATKEGRKPLIVYVRGSNGKARMAVQNRDKGVVRAYKRDREIEIYAVEEVLSAIRQLRVGKIHEEYKLQAAIADVFDKHGIAYIKECRLGSGNRVDFLTHNGVAVEVKKGKPNRTRLINQINRYAEYPKVKAVVIVVETSLRIPVMQTTNGKPCTVVGLQKLWGIAL